jgi:hypothetical protein
VYLDTLRGLLLVVMAINHVPNELQRITDHPFGFMSAAEGFVFMSGLMAGMVYTRRFLQSGITALRDGCLGRARQIYQQHLLIYFCVLALVSVFTLLQGKAPPNAPLQMILHPWRAVLVGPLLLSQPSLLDILPFYCAFMLLCPLLILGCEAGHRFPILAASFGVWLVVNVTSPQAPLLNTPTFHSGAFNLFAWQILFVAGVVFGHAKARQQVLLAPPTFATVLPIAGLAIVLFAARHAWLQLPLPRETLSWLTNKNNLAPLRFLDTALLFWLTHAVLTRWPNALSWRPLAALGRHSLPVFSAHVLVAYVILAEPAVFNASKLGQFAGIAILLGAMAVTAIIADRQKKKARLHPAISKQALGRRRGLIWEKALRNHQPAHATCVFNASSSV